jgi:hypothetical protein
MTEPFSTIGGVATKDEAYRKLIYHLDEAINQCLVIGHFYNTEDDNVSKTIAKGWYGIGNEMLPMMKEQIRQIAMRKMQ